MGTWYNQSVITDLRTKLQFFIKDEYKVMRNLREEIVQEIDVDDLEFSTEDLLPRIGKYSDTLFGELARKRRSVRVHPTAEKKNTKPSHSVPIQKPKKR